MSLRELNQSPENRDRDRVPVKTMIAVLIAGLTVAGVGGGVGGGYTARATQAEAAASVEQLRSSVEQLRAEGAEFKGQIAEDRKERQGLAIQLATIDQKLTDIKDRLDRQGK